MYTGKILAAFLLLCSASVAATEVSVTAEIWGDNWFEMYVDGNKVIEDSVPITTERSFNAETANFNMAAGAQIAIIAKDFIENDTGLEYINSRRQQMGDGGLIAQIKDASGNVLAVTDDTARCLVIHHAPADPACADEDTPVAGEGNCAFTKMDAPEGWMDADFDDSEWQSVTVYTEAQVSPKFGYDEIRWDDAAKLIWTQSLTQDNTLLCRLHSQM